MALHSPKLQFDESLNFPLLLKNPAKGDPASSPLRRPLIHKIIPIFSERDQLPRTEPELHGKSWRDRLGLAPAEASANAAHRRAPANYRPSGRPISLPLPPRFGVPASTGQVALSAAAAGWYNECRRHQPRYHRCSTERFPDWETSLTECRMSSCQRFYRQIPEQ